MPSGQVVLRQADDGRDNALLSVEGLNAEQLQRAWQQHVSSDTLPGSSTESLRQQAGELGTRKRQRSVDADAAAAGSASSRSYRPALHVLLSPGGDHSTCPQCSQGACGAVFAFGLHNSGIYALV